MLDTLRKNASGWVGMIFIGLIALSFAVWGVADIFRGYSSDVVAEVGTEEVPANRFRLEYQQQLEELSDRLGRPIGPVEGREYGLDRQVIARLVGMAALNAQVEEMGLAVADETVAKDIYEDPSFHGPFNRFDQQTFDLILAQNRIDEQTMINDRREFLERDQLLSAAISGTHVPDALTELIYGYRNEKRLAEYIILTPDMASDPEPPTEEEIEELHEKAAANFSTPETRSFDVLVIRPDTITASIEIGEEALAEAFEERRDQYDEPETRTLYQIPFAEMEAAEKAASNLRQGDTLENVLAPTGLSEEDVLRENLTRGDLLSKDVADAAFALEEGEVSEPLDGALGPVVIKVLSVTPAKPAKLADVREELTKQLASEQAVQDVFDIYNRVEDERAAGVPLADIAAQVGIPLERVESVTRDGLKANGEPADVPDLVKLLETAFTMEEGEEVDAIETEDDGYYWIDLTGVNAPAVKPLEEVRDQVVDLWMREKRRGELVELAESLSARGNGGEPFEVIAGEFDRAVLTSPPLSRRSSNETFSRFAVANLFGTPEGKFTFGSVGYGDSLLLMKVKDVRTPAVADNKEAVASLEETLRETTQDDVVGTLVASLQEKYGISVNQTLINRIIGN